jgi:hypothetical protein
MQFIYYSESFNELYEDILKIQSLRKLQVNGIRGMIFPSTWISKMSQLKILLISKY